MRNHFRTKDYNCNTRLADQDYRMRDALWVRLYCGCSMKNVKTWVNGKCKTWSMDCSDTRVGEWKLAVPILRRSQHSYARSLLIAERAAL